MNLEKEIFYKNVVQGVNALVASNSSNFDTANINLNKCVSCIVSNYCGHKSGRRKTFKFPYAINDMILTPVKLPDELRKK